MPSSRALSVQPAKQLRQADLQNVCDLPHCVHGDVDPAAFEQADVRAMQIGTLDRNHSHYGQELARDGHCFGFQFRARA
jgi:hypothetical protein